MPGGMESDAYYSFQYPTAGRRAVKQPRGCGGVCRQADVPVRMRTTRKLLLPAYLEVHHMTRLADRGPDVSENAIAT